MSDQLTWMGHSTVLLDLAGIRVITDPLLRSRVVHLRRHSPPPATPARSTPCCSRTCTTTTSISRRCACCPGCP